MPTKVWIAGEEVLASDWNQLVQEQVIATFATAAARTAAIATPKVGMLTYLADSQRLDRWDGVGWYALPYGQLGYNQITANSGIFPLTATAIPGLGFTIPASRLPAGRIVMLELVGIIDATGATNAANAFYVNGAQIGQANLGLFGAGNGTIHGRVRYVATGVQAVVEIRSWQSAAQGAKFIATATYPTYIAATDMGAV